MAALNELLPPTKSITTPHYDHSNDPWFKERYSSSYSASASFKRNPAPLYGKRSAFVPRRPEDFGDGGAFPEIHVAQYPLGMGRKDQKPGFKILALTVHSLGKVAFDAIVKQNENASKIVYSQLKDLVPMVGLEDDNESEEEKEIEETTQRTKEALEILVEYSPAKECTNAVLRFKVYQV